MPTICLVGGSGSGLGVNSHDPPFAALETAQKKRERDGLSS